MYVSSISDSSVERLCGAGSLFTVLRILRKHTTVRVHNHEAGLSYLTVLIYDY